MRFANILLLPLVSLGLIAAALTLIIYRIAPPAGVVLAFVPRVLMDAVSYLTRGFSSVPPGMIELSAFPAAAGVLIYLALIAASPVCLAKSRRKLTVAAGLLFASAAIIVFAQ